MSDDLDASLETIRKKLKEMDLWAQLITLRNKEYDHLGQADEHPEGSESRKIAEFRDEVDRAFSNFAGAIRITARLRAEHSFSCDLLCWMVLAENGDGYDALHLMERLYKLTGDDSDEDGEVTPETFPDQFAWETYNRVIALNELINDYPKHIRHSARQMRGWPMIVSHHLDGTAEFKRIAELLQIGANHPLDTGPRPKRGTETPFLRYLEHRLWRVDVLRTIYHETDRFWKKGNRIKRVRQFWRQDRSDPEPDEDLVNILVRVPDLPRLSDASAPQWAREVLVPLIMHQDAADPETCEIPVLQEIWRHRSVKSRATFESRLFSRVLDTLRRYAPKEADGLRGIDA